MLERAELIGYTTLRIVSGLVFSLHGWQKIFGVLTTKGPATDTQMWIGGLIELVCGTLLALGLTTRAMAFLASGTMAVAYIQFHWKFDFDERFFPVKNGGELSLVYCFLFLFMTVRGSGAISIDRLIFGPRSKLAGT